MRRGSKLRAIGAAAVAVLAWRLACTPSPSIRIATFNIENYPKSDRQEAGAFEAISALSAKAIAVQEIVDTAAFEAAAQRRLGHRWRFTFADHGPPQHVGVLYDRDALILLSSETHDETVIYDGAKPAFEARFKKKQDGGGLRMIVVHLKAGGEGISLRAKQLIALAPIVERALATGDDVALLGDFNATSDADRSAIAALHDATGLAWASEGLACTSYWERTDGCRGTALDHVLTKGAPRAIVAGAACATEGCDERSKCPAFRDEVSDHCPVAVDLR